MWGGSGIYGERSNGDVFVEAGLPPDRTDIDAKKMMQKDDILWDDITRCFGCGIVSQALDNTQKGGAVIFASLGTKAKQQKEQERRSREQPTGELDRNSVIGIAPPHNGGDLTNVREVIMGVNPGYPWLKRDAFVGDVGAVYADRNCAHHF